MSSLLKHLITISLASLFLVASASCATVSSSKSSLKSISVSPTDVHIYANYGKQLNVFAVYADRTEKDVTANSTYRSSSEKVATVTSVGFVEGIDRGTADITIYYTEGGVTQNTTVPVIIELFGGTETLSGIS